MKRCKCAARHSQGPELSMITAAVAIAQKASKKPEKMTVKASGAPP